MGKQLRKTVYYGINLEGPIVHEFAHPIRADSPSDCLEEWISQNTLNSNSFSGENGVSCHIRQRAVETGNVESLSRESAADPGKEILAPYSRVVRIDFQPASKEIPAELNSALREMGYSQIPSDSELIRKAGL